MPPAISVQPIDVDHVR